MTHLQTLTRLLAGGALALSTPLAAGITAAQQAALADHCNETGCEVQLTGTAMLEAANRLIEAERFDEAETVLAALENSPELADQVDFLRAQLAVATGKTDRAIGLYRGLLEAQPNRTRVRLELARALMTEGRTASADHHFRLAAQDDNLPEEVSRMVRTVRGLIRDRRGWHLDVDIGIAPDTNINNATNTETVDFVAGGIIFPLNLAEENRATSGVGQTVGIAGGLKIGLSSNIALAFDADTRFTNYSGSDFDDLSGTLAIGPEIRFNDRNRLSIQALASQRFYGWDDAQRAFGLRADYQRQLNRGARFAVAVDGRQLHSGFGDQFSGWQTGIYGSYEQVLNRSMVASASLFARRDFLNSEAYSNSEIGARFSIAGELPLGINAGISAGGSRALFDGPLPLFSVEARRDWRVNGQINLGLRSIRMLGFSPSVTYGYSRTDSSISLFQSDRHRIQFGLARYF